MKLHYLGTGAAERVPAIFCHCAICDHARKVGGHDVRTQTQAIVDDGQLLIDFPGDSYLHALRDGVDFSDMTELLITHWHSDHLYAEDLALRMRGYGQNLTAPLNVYVNPFVQQFYDRAFELEERTDDTRILRHTFHNGEPFMAGAYKVWPIAAEHGHRQGDCTIYVIQGPDGKTMLWTHDCALFSETMYKDLVATGVRLDYISLDCNNQNLQSGPGAPHMSWTDDQVVLKRLRELGLMDDDTRVVLNHFSHNSGMTHDEMVALVAPFGIEVAYDGMTVEF